MLVLCLCMYELWMSGGKGGITPSWALAPMYARPYCSPHHAMRGTGAAALSGSSGSGVCMRH